MTDPIAPFSPLVERAIEIAAEWHDGTYRKGRWTDPCVLDADGRPARVPAMAHVTAVAMTVQRTGWNDEAVAAAFLHDALEDPNGRGETLDRETLQAMVGESVVRIVEAVSEPKVDADGGWLPWRVRKEAYLASLAAGPTEAVAVSLADKLHNARSIERDLHVVGEALWERFTGKKEGSLWYYGQVVDALAHQWEHRILGELRTTVATVRRLAG